MIPVSVNGRRIVAVLDSGADICVLNAVDGEFLRQHYRDYDLEVTTVLGDDMLPVNKNVEIVVGGVRRTCDLALSSRPDMSNLFSRSFPLFPAMLGNSCFAFIDDIIICADSAEEAITRLVQFLALYEEPVEIATCKSIARANGNAKSP